MNDDLPASPEPSFVQRLKRFGIFILFLWLIEIIDRLFFQNSLENHGINPRELSDLEGILFAPFLHDGWGHLFGNSISLLILGSAILARGWRDLAIVSALSALCSGILVWLIGQNGSNHIGASSLVFGYLGFLFASGFYERTPLTIIVSILILIFYGSAISGLFPTDAIINDNISWEAHLGGAIGGLLVARSKRLKRAPSSSLATDSSTVIDLPEITPPTQESDHKIPKDDSITPS